MNIMYVGSVKSAIFCSYLFALCASGANRTWSGAANDGNQWETAGNWAEGAVPGSGDAAIFNASGGTVTVAVTDLRTVQQLVINGTADVVINIAADTRFSVANGGGTGISVNTANLTINGPGKLGFSTVGGINHLDNYAQPGRTLTLNAEIVNTDGSASTGVETYRSASPSGAVAFNCLTNAFTMDSLFGGGHTVVVPKLTDRNLPSSLGTGANININNNSVLRYEGTGDTTDRAFLMNGTNGGGIEQAGTGPLIITGPVYNNNNSVQTLSLLGNSAFEGRITGDIYNNQSTLAVRKDGTGTWVLSGANAFTGGLTINAGTLGLDSPTAAGNNTQITIAPSATLAINPSAAADFTMALPPIVASGNMTLSVTGPATAGDLDVTFGGLSAADLAMLSITPAAAGTSTVTLGTLATARLDITAPGIGTPANRILIPSFPAGAVDSWLILNGGPARYDLTDGLLPMSLTPKTGIKTRGDTLFDGPLDEAVIDTIGGALDPAIQLQLPLTTLYRLTMAVPGDDAVVDTAGKALMANVVAIEAGAGALTIGALPEDGSLLPQMNPPQSATLTLRNDSTAPLTINATLAPPQSSTATPLPVIIDNTDAVFTGNWPFSTSNAGYYGINYQHDDNNEKGNKTALFSTLLPCAGKWTVAGYWPYDTTRATAVPMDITHAAGTDTVIVSQRSTGGAWYNLGTYTFNTSTPASVLIRTTGTDSHVIADAVRFTLVNENPFSLFKLGSGDVILAGGAMLSDLVRIDQGTLFLDTPAGITNLLPGLLFGGGKLTKTGPGHLFLANTTANLHTGGTDITAGLVQASHSRSLGTGPVAIATGGTLDIGGSLSTDALIISNPITVSGAGADGLGAIVHNGIVQQRNAFQNTSITLTGPTTFGGTSTCRWDLAGVNANATLATLDLNGFPLTKAGVTDFRLSPVTIINAPAGLAFDIQQGSLGIETSSTLSPNDTTREINIAAGARFGLYQLHNPLHWKINPADGATIWAYGGNEAFNQNILTSDITLPGTLNLTATAGSYNKTLAGKLTGPGGLNINGNGNRTVHLLSNPANDFTGPITVNNAVLGLRVPGSFPGYPSFANLTLQGNGCVGVFMGGPGEWTSADVATLTSSGKFLNNGNRLNIRVEQGNTATLTHDIGSTATPFIAAFDKNGQGTLVIESNVTLASSTSARMNNGAITLTNNAIWTAGIENLYLSDYTLNDGTGTPLSTLTLCDNAKYLSTDRGFDTGNGSPSIRIPQNNNGKAVVRLKDNAFVRANITLGGWDNQNGTHGAVYQSGNSEWLCTGGAGNDATIGRAGYGHYQLDSGTLTLKGYTTLGWSENDNSIGILRQTGGTLAFNGLRDPLPAKEQIGDSYNGEISLSRGGTGILHLEGGQFIHYGGLKILSEHNGNNSAGNNGTAIMTIAGTADAMVDRQLEMGNRNNGTAILNLNGGTLTATHILRRYRAAGTATINLNGGTLRVTNDAPSTALFLEENTAAPLIINAYANGGTIELGPGVTRTLDIPIRQPDGAGVQSIAITSGGLGYIAPPHVRITGGGGSGATAIAHINPADGSLARIEITCPGRGYTATPSVSLVGGGPATGAALSTITLARNDWGGLTKTGPGTLTLNAANSYLGPTRVEGGTLLLANPQAINERSEIIIGDGTLDLNGLTITNNTVTLLGTGTIINGKVFTASATKAGDGPSIWSAEIGFISAPGLPGLWEGYIPGRQNTTLPNPCTSIELTTTAANGYANSNGSINGKSWPDNSTWVYTGYIWNRADTNETWTFAEHFDDDVLIVIDKVTVLNNTSSSTYSSANYTLTPGPHLFEIRFGQGGGNVGASGTSHWFNNTLADRIRGWGIDFQGRNSTTYGDFVLPTDPGDGSLFTATLGKEDPDTALRVLSGTLLLPPVSGLLDGLTIEVGENGTLDLNGQPCDNITVTGSGKVINAAPGSGLTLSPGGDDRTGSLSVVGSLNGATYRLTVHDFPPGHYDDTPGLYEGRVVQGNGNGNITTVAPNPSLGDPNAIELTVTAANGTGTGDNFVINGKVWPFYSTYIYTGYIWNRADTNETWTFAKSFDDHVWIKIDNTVHMNHGTWNAVTKVQVTLTPGPHPFEIRFGQGNGGIGYQRQSWWNNGVPTDPLMSVGIDFLGRDQEDYANYSPLHAYGNPHEPLFTVTMKTDPDNGVINDLLTSPGQLNLTGLTIVPSDEPSKDLPGDEYLIATAAGGFTGAAKVQGFSGNKRWLTVRRGNDLWLSTKGGTILILR